jgi:hypothetical protein
MSDNEKLNGLEILEMIIKKFDDDFAGNIEKIKIGDLLKVIELKEKLSVTGTAERTFWKMINKLRENELVPGSKATALLSGTKPKTVRRKKTVTVKVEAGTDKV